MNNPHSPINPFLFREAPGGYVFRAPSPWMFGRGRRYFVTDAQKGELLGPTRSDVVLAVLASAIVSSREMRSGGCQSLAFVGTFISALRRYSDAVP